MNTSSKIFRSIFALSVLAFLAGVPAAFCQGTTFTYQGRLADGGSPVSGNYDLRFTLWDSSVGGLQVGPIITVAPVPVSSGLFTVPLNFGPGVFTGPARYLQIEARVFGAGSYSPPINPRQALQATPYAIAAGNLTGTLPASQLAGTIPPGNLSPNVALLNRDPQNFTGQNNFGGFVGIGTTSPSEPLHVNGRYVRVEGAGGEAAYLGGDGAGSDIQVGSLNPGVVNVALYNAALGFYMNLFAQDISYAGLQSKLDVADNFTATVRAADFTLGYSGRRGSPGRALVDFGTALYVNFASDWADTVVNSRLTVAASDMFIGRKATGNFGGASGFDFNPSASDGLIIEQVFPHAGPGGTESSGIYFDGDSIAMWSPGDNNRLLSIYDEDNMVERFYISGSGQAVANGVVLTSSRRFKERVAPIASALDKVMRLQGVTFDWVNDKGGKPGIGFIAEDVAKVLPALVEWEENGKDAVGLQYANVTAVTVEAIKELKAQKDQEIEALKKRNAELESRLAQLEALENARESRLAALEKSLRQQVDPAQEASLKNGGGQ